MTYPTTLLRSRWTIMKVKRSPNETFSLRISRGERFRTGKTTYYLEWKLILEENLNIWSERINVSLLLYELSNPNHDSYLSTNARNYVSVLIQSNFSFFFHRSNNQRVSEIVWIEKERSFRLFGNKRRERKSNLKEEGRRILIRGACRPFFSPWSIIRLIFVLSQHSLSR